MTETPHDMHELLEQVRNEQDRALADAERRESVRRRLAILEPSTLKPAPKARLVAATSVILVAAALLLSYLTAAEHEAPRLAYQIEGESRGAGEFLSTAPDESMTLRFFEGSTVELEQESSARVERLTHRGARLSLEHGSAEVSVHHEEETQWHIQSGPYAVRVIGTRFRISWDAPQREFSLVMHEGEVRVDGPFGHRTLRAGQSMRVGPESDTEIAVEPHDTPEREPPPPETSAETSGDDETPPPPTQSATAPRPTRATPLTPAPVRAAEHASQWRAHLQNGDAQAALRSIQNVSEVRTHATLAELRALSTVARRARSPLEANLYLAIRSRFGGTAAAAEAAFLSGRRAQHAGRLREADRWFQTYLRESPQGQWSAEATGRRIETLLALGREEAARSWAQRYLDRYPRGSHSALARSILPTE